MGGRRTSLTIALTDKPGQLVEVSTIISDCGANVIAVHHDHSDPNMAITSCFLTVTLETRDHEQAEEIKRKLASAGFELV